MTPEALVIENMFMVPDKEGRNVPFILNDEQRHLDANLTGRDIIPKARQMGISTYFLGRYTAACMVRTNVRAVVISHEGDATQRLLARVHYFIEHMDPRPVIRRASANLIMFEKTGSMFYIGTAGARAFGRGDTITHLHCSEVAYWLNAKQLLSGLFDAVPESGEIALESTGNGIGNDYHSRCMRAAEGVGRYTTHFISWMDRDEYQVPVTSKERYEITTNPNVDWEEDKIVTLLTPEQMMWRRYKLEEKDFDLRLFKQEFPMTLDECFQSTQETLFQYVRFVPTPNWKKDVNDGHLWRLDNHPIVGHHYALGVDPAGGVGKDNGVIQIIDLDDCEQVAEYASNLIEPDVLGVKAALLAREFNNAYITVEANNHGLVTLDNLTAQDENGDTLYPFELIYVNNSGSLGSIAGEDERILANLGLKTTVRSKPLMVGKLRTALAKYLTIHSTMLNSELSTFIEHPNGQLKAEDNCHDDRVMALAVCVQTWNRAALMLGQNQGQNDNVKVRDPFALDTIIEDARSGHNGGSKYPIAAQHRSS